MKFNFKIQQYQTDAVESTVAILPDSQHKEDSYTAGI